MHPAAICAGVNICSTAFMYSLRAGASPSLIGFAVSMIARTSSGVLPASRAARAASMIVRKLSSDGLCAAMYASTSDLT
jgi:hypothetical protein